LFCFTDGLADLKNDDGVYFGEDKIIEFVKSNSKYSPKKQNENLMSEIDKFKGTQAYVDDIAILTTKLN